MCKLLLGAVGIGFMHISWYNYGNDPKKLGVLWLWLLSGKHTVKAIEHGHL